MTKVSLGITPIVVGEGGVGIKFDRLIIVDDSFLVLTKIKLGITPIQVCEGGVGIKFDRLIIVGEGFLVLTKVSLGITPIVVGEGGVGIKFDRLIIVDDSFLVLTKSELDIAPIVVGISTVGFQTDRLIIVDDSFLVLTKIKLSIALFDEGACLAVLTASGNRGAYHGSHYDPVPFFGVANHYCYLSTSDETNTFDSPGQRRQRYANASAMARDARAQDGRGGLDCVVHGVLFIGERGGRKPILSNR